MLFPALGDPTDRLALRFGERTLTYAQLRGAAAPWPARGRRRARGVWAVDGPETAVAVVGALLAGVPIVPINPKAGERELEHILADSAPETVLCAPGVELPAALAARPRVDVDLDARAAATCRPSRRRRRPRSSSTRPARPGRRRAPCCRGARSPPTSTRSPTRGSGPATTSSPTRCRSSTSTGWSSASLGPLRRGGGDAPPRPLLRRGGVAAALRDGATMLFGVPTMYHRLAADAEEDAAIAERAARRRACSCPARPRCPAADHERIERLSGQRIVERYGMTETLMNTASAPTASAGRATSGRRWPASRSACSTTTGDAIDAADDETIGEIARPRAEPLPRVPQPPRRHRRGDAATAGSHRRPRHARARRLHPHRRPPRHRPDQERRLQDRRRRDRGRAARAPRRARGGGHRRARPGPRRADRRLGRPEPKAPSPTSRRAGRPRRRAAHAAQAPARRAPARRAAAQRDGQGPEGSGSAHEARRSDGVRVALAAAALAAPAGAARAPSTCASAR